MSKFAIQQHCEEERDGYNTTLFPCSGSIKGTLHIMWVKVAPSRPQNHIIPLLMTSKFILRNAYYVIFHHRKYFDDNQLRCQPDTKFVQDSLKFNLCSFCANSPEKTTDHTMVQCDICSKWLHCSYIGISIQHFTDAGQAFVCCTPPAEDNDFQ